MSISYVQATWTATALSANFDHYEIERTENAVDFYMVAEITTEAVTEYRDYEPTRGGIAGYRLRVVRTDGAVSDWTAVESELIPESTEWALVSNEAPDLNMEVLVWSDEQETHKWGLNTKTQKIYAIAGRDGAVAMRSLETTLDEFTLAVLVFDLAHDGLERAVADPIETLANEDLAYVCVHSPGSRRWLANLTVTEMEQQSEGQVYTIPTRIRELTRVPSVVDVAVL